MPRIGLKIALAILSIAEVLGGGLFVPLVLSEPPPAETKSEKQRVLTDRFGDPLPPGAVARVGTVRWWCGYIHGPLAYAPDGKSLAWCDDFGTVHFLDTVTGRELRRIETPDKGPDQASSCFALAPNGKTVVTASYKSPILRLWDVSTGKELRQLAGDKLGTSAVAFSPDGKTFAAATDTGIRLWDTATWKEIRRLTGKDAGWSRSIAFLPDGKTILSGGPQPIRWWDVRTGREVRRLDKDFVHKIYQFALSPDGKRLAAVVSPNVLCLWDAHSGEEVRRTILKPKRVSRCLCFSPDSQTLACGDGVGLWGNQTLFFAADTGRELRHWDEGNSFTQQLAFSPDGKILAQARSDVIRLRNVQTGEFLRPTRGMPDYVMAVRFAPDGKALVVGCYGGHLSSYDPLTGEPLALSQPPPKDFGRRPDMLLTPALTADGKKAALVNDKGVLHVWEPATGKTCCRIAEPPASKEEANFSPDGKALVVAHKDGVVRLWDTTTGKMLRDFPQTKTIRFPRPLVLSPDGRILATASSSEPEKTIRLWDTATGKERGRLAWRDETAPTCLAFSSDGKYLLAAHNQGGMDVEDYEKSSLRLWGLASGRELRRLPLPNGYVWGMSMSPDGKTLAVAVDRTIFLWELASGQERGRFTGHREWIRSLAFSPDGRLLASGSRDYTALVWDVTGLCPDGQWSARDVQPEEIERLWADLVGADAARAYRALWRMVAADRQSTTFLAQHFRPVPPVADERLSRLIADLDSDQFGTRNQASKELEQLGELAEPAMRKALMGKPTLEVRWRLQTLLGQMERRTLSREQLRVLRALEVLEHIGTPEAQKALKTLAEGASAARLTREAKVSLERLAGLSHPKP